jgi:ureidoacrylate peracid hydrolase
MHKVGLPEEIRQRIRERRGRQHVFDRLDPRRAALIVVDMQNHFVDLIPTCRGIVPNINRIAQALRAAGGTVAWIQATHTDTGRSAWPMFFEHFVGAEVAANIRRKLAPGAEGHALFAELDVQDEDLIVPKDRFSALIQGASNLEAELRARGIDSVIITGTNTNVCCESTARDAMMLDFKTFMVEDANAAFSDAEHVAGLTTVAQVFADVLSTDEMLALIAARPLEDVGAA